MHSWLRPHIFLAKFPTCGSSDILFICTSCIFFWKQHSELWLFRNGSKVHWSAKKYLHSGIQVIYNHGWSATQHRTTQCLIFFLILFYLRLHKRICSDAIQFLTCSFRCGMLSSKPVLKTCVRPWWILWSILIRCVLKIIDIIWVPKIFNVIFNVICYVSNLLKR